MKSLPISKFHKNRTQFDRLDSGCKDCKKERSQRRKLHFDKLFKIQSGMCAICGIKKEPKKLTVDHCHITNDVRGLLCIQCNLGLGYYGDNKDKMARAIKYLKEHEIKYLSNNPIRKLKDK